MIKIACLILFGFTSIATAQQQKPYQQQMRNYQHYDDKTRVQETPLQRERREYQERWPQVQHCRLPACSTR